MAAWDVTIEDSETSKIKPTPVPNWVEFGGSQAPTIPEGRCATAGQTSHALAVINNLIPEGSLCDESGATAEDYNCHKGCTDKNARPTATLSVTMHGNGERTLFLFPRPHSSKQPHSPEVPWF